MFAVMMAAFSSDIFNVDEFRHGVERMAPAEYLGTSYYEHWLHSLERMMIEKGQISRAELQAAWAEAETATVAATVAVAQAT